MSSSYDVAVVGGGLSGLVCAAYLARAGRSVVVLEALDRVGGTLATDEIADGFTAPAAFASAELLHPAVVSELGLAGHGLSLAEGGGTFLPLPAGGHFHVDRRHPDGRRNGGLSAADARALVAFEAFHRRLVEALAPAWAAPLPDPDPRGLAALVDLLRLGWRLRRLGAEEMTEAMRLVPMAIQDVLDERFESPALKAALAAPALWASWLGPRSAGSYLGLLHHRPAWCGDLFAPPKVVLGGVHRLPEAVAAAASAAGAEIRTSAAVTAIAVEAGRATGVVVDGETLGAGLVVSALDPRRTLLELADPSWLDPEQVTGLTSLRSRGSVAVVRFALERLPRFDSAPEGDAHLAGRIQLGADLDTLERAYDEAKYGREPKAPLVELLLPSLLDPEMAPPGRHVAVATVQFAPRRLAEGSWAEAGERLADTVTAAIDDVAPGFAAAVLARDVVTPADVEARFSLTGGCLYHAEMALDQVLYMRPLPGWFGYATPIDALYLCGPGTHPGGGVTGLPGRNAARVVAGR